MDSITHLAMGIGLAGLAHLNASIHGNPTTATAIMLATAAGSVIPDVDILYALGSDALYIKHHRGWTHSFPMLFIWPTLLMLGLHLFFPEVSLLLLWSWTAVALIVHLLVDMLTPYGTQFLWPMSSAWIAWRILNVFDPFVLALHVIGIILWGIGILNPGYIFMTIYTVLIIYSSWRLYSFIKVNRCLPMLFKKTTYKYLMLMPTFAWRTWEGVAKLDDHIIRRRICKEKVVEELSIPLAECTHPAVVVAADTPAVQVLQYAHPYEVETQDTGFKVRFIDVRYYYKGEFPVASVVLLDTEYKVIAAFTGWRMTAKRIAKKVKRYGF